MNGRQYLWNGSFLAFACLAYAILLIPILMIILTSFTPRQFPTLPRTGVTFKWYFSLFANATIRNALIMSLIVASFTSILSGTLGTIAAFGFVRSDFRYKGQISTLMLLPLMVSPVITGIALVNYLSAFSGIVPIIIGHAILTMPYVFLIVRSELLTFDQSLESASRILGAGPLESVINVTLPTISSAVISAALVSFVVSFGEFTATQFLVSPGTTTVPVIIYTQLRSGLTPDISALSTLLVLIMFGAAAISGIISRN